MHGSMAGYHEVTVNGPNRHHYRLFCLLERDGGVLGLGGPSLVVLAGLDKAFMTTLSENDYAKVRALGDEYGPGIQGAWSRRKRRSRRALSLLPLGRADGPKSSLPLSRASRPAGAGSSP